MSTPVLLRLTAARLLPVAERVAAEHDVPLPTLLSVTGRVSPAQAALFRALPVPPAEVARLLGWGEAAVRRELGMAEARPTPAPESGVTPRKKRGRPTTPAVEARLATLEEIVSGYTPEEQKSVRQRLAMLERSVAALLAKNDLRRRVATLEEKLAGLTGTLDALLDRPTPAVRYTRIAQEVAEKHGTTVAALRGRARSGETAEARRELVQRLADEGASSTAIGTFLGGRDHTTILFYLNGDRRVKGEPRRAAA